jgi:hypothetical protein
MSCLRTETGPQCNVQPVRYPCPCCGHVVFDEEPGSYDICPICFWEDDVAQLRFPNMGGGPNYVSLIESQANFALFGAVERRLIGHVRPPGPNEPIDEGWRPVDPSVDHFEPFPDPRPESTYATEYPRDPTVLYYWRPSFWRASGRIS